MLVRDLMTTEVVTLQETDTLLDASMIFVRSTLHHVPILRGKQLVGVVTDRDVKRFTPSVLSGITANEYNQLMETTPLSTVMTRNPLSTKPDEPVMAAARTFSTQKIGCLPVVENGEVVGILTTTDMLKLLSRLLEAQTAAAGELPSP
jgi:acetoin utilization protein AcuB